MNKALKLVLLAVLFVGFTPAQASLPKDTGCSIVDNFGCHNETPKILSGQEGGGIIDPDTDSDLLKDFLKRPFDSIEKDNGITDRNYNVVNSMEAAGFKLRNAVWYEDEKGYGDTEAVYGCENCSDLDPYAGLRHKVKIIGKDDRVLVGAQHAREASAVGMVFCSKVVNGKNYSQASTGTIVGSQSTVLASAHAVYETDQSSQNKIQYDIKRDCDFRKYINGEIVFKSGFLSGEFGTHQTTDNPFQDWSVLRLRSPNTMAQPLEVSILNVGKMKESSRVNIQLIAHHHDTASTRDLYLSDGVMQLTRDINGHRVLGHDADTNGRASGAALIYTRSSGAKTIFGIHTGGLNGKNLNRVIPIDSKILDAVKRAMKTTGVST